MSEKRRKERDEERDVVEMSKAVKRHRKCMNYNLNPFVMPLFQR